MHGAAFLRKHGENAGYRFSPGRPLRHYSALADRCPCGFPEVFPKYLHPQILSLEVVLFKGAGQSLMVAKSGRKTLFSDDSWIPNAGDTASGGKVWYFSIIASQAIIQK